MKKILIIFVIVASMLTSCSSDTGESEITQNTQNTSSSTMDSQQVNLGIESSTPEKGEISSTATEASTMEVTTTTTETSTQANEPIDEYSKLEFSTYPINPTDKEKMLAENIEGADTLDKYRVKSIDELLKVLGRDRIIYLYPGSYDFYSSELLKGTDRNDINGKSPYYYVDGGYACNLVYYGLKNTSFIGVPADGESEVRYQTENKFSTIITLENCSDISLSNLNISHVNVKSISNAELAVIGSNGVDIEHCTISGDGFPGLHFFKTRDLSIKDSAIINCSTNKFDTCSWVSFTNTELSTKCTYNFLYCTNFTFEKCFMSDSLMNKFSFGSVEAFMDSYRDNVYLVDDGEIVFDWISGLKDFRSNAAKIVFSNGVPQGDDLEYHLTVSTGFFYKKVPDSESMNNIGSEYIGDNIDGLYWSSGPKKNLTDYFEYSIKSKSNPQGAKKSGKCIILYDSMANQYFTLNELGIPSIMNPQGTAYIKLEELLSYDKLRLDDLVGLYGNSYTIKKDGYLYKNGLTFNYNKDDNLVTNLSFGNMQYFPHRVYKLHGYLNDDGIKDTLVALYSYIGIQINGSEEFTYWEKIPGIDVKLVDINYDGISEIHLPSQPNKLYSIKHDRIINVFDKLNTELHNIFEYELIGSELLVGYKSGISGTRKSVIFNIPEDLSFKKADGLDLPVMTDTLKIGITQNNFEWVFKGECIIHLKTGEYGSKSGSSISSTPFDKEDLLIDAARIIVVGRYLGEELEIISADVTSKFDGIYDYTKNKYMDVSDLGFEGLFGIDSSEEEALNALNGKAKLGNEQGIYKYFKCDSLSFATYSGKVGTMSLDSDEYATIRGLRVGDTRENLVELYGYPDLGFIDDNRMSYFVWENGKPVYNLKMHIVFSQGKIAIIEFQRVY